MIYDLNKLYLQWTKQNTESTQPVHSSKPTGLNTHAAVFQEIYIPNAWETYFGSFWLQSRSQAIPTVVKTIPLRLQGRWAIWHSRGCQFRCCIQTKCERDKKNKKKAWIYKPQNQYH